MHFTPPVYDNLYGLFFVWKYKRYMSFAELTRERSQREKDKKREKERKLNGYENKQKQLCTIFVSEFE